LDGQADGSTISGPSAISASAYADWYITKKLEQEELPPQTFKWPEEEFSDNFVKTYESLWVNPMTKYICYGDLTPPRERDGTGRLPAPFNGAVSVYDAAVEGIKGIPTDDQRPHHWGYRHERISYEQKHCREFGDAYRLCRLLFSDGVKGLPSNFEDVCERAANLYGHGDPGGGTNGW
jgi:hypothetical protein